MENIGAIDPTESEILFGRGHTYQIIKAWIEDGMKHVEMEVLD